MAYVLQLANPILMIKNQGSEIISDSELPFMLKLQNKNDVHRASRELLERFLLCKTLGVQKTPIEFRFKTQISKKSKSLKDGYRSKIYTYTAKINPKHNIISIKRINNDGLIIDDDDDDDNDDLRGGAAMTRSRSRSKTLSIPARTSRASPPRSKSASRSKSTSAPRTARSRSSSPPRTVKQSKSSLPKEVPIKKEPKEAPIKKEQKEAPIKKEPATKLIPFNYSDIKHRPKVVIEVDDDDDSSSSSSEGDRNNNRNEWVISDRFLDAASDDDYGDDDDDAGVYLWKPSFYSNKSKASVLRMLSNFVYPGISSGNCYFVYNPTDFHVTYQRYFNSYFNKLFRFRYVMIDSNEAVVSVDSSPSVYLSDEDDDAKIRKFYGNRKMYRVEPEDEINESIRNCKCLVNQCLQNQCNRLYKSNNVDDWWSKLYTFNGVGMSSMF